MEHDEVFIKRMLIASTFIFILGLIGVGRLEQPQWYHDFSDARTIFGIPNAFDVLSNIALLIPGAFGIALVKDMKRIEKGYRDPFELTMLTTLFSGIILIFFGSMWYHLSPDDDTMVWDRLPMTIVFASLTSLVISDRWSVEIAKKVHWPLVAIGISSILLWHFTGDLRPYMFFKHEPIIFIVVLLVFTTGAYDRSKDYFIALGLFLAATIFELADKQVFEILNIMSGHTIKHLLAGLACWYLFKMIQNRQILEHLEDE
jgi:hypothetical protein